MYVYSSSMILSHISISKTFYKIFKVLFLAVFLFQAGPADRPVDRSLCPGHARLCMSVGRPTGRPTESSLLSGFLGRPTGRPPSKNCVSFLRTVDRLVDPSPTALCQQGGRPPDRSTVKPAKPQRLFPLWCNSEICF